MRRQVPQCRSSSAFVQFLYKNANTGLSMNSFTCTAGRLICRVGGGDLVFKTGANLALSEGLDGIIGPVPTSWSTTPTVPVGVVLQNSASNGTNVFFGAGILVSGSNTIDIASSGSVRFNGSTTQLLGDVSISTH